MSDFSRITDHGDDNGLCRGCRHWQAGQADRTADAAVGLCLQPELTHFSLQVSGESGCNRFEARAGVPARELAGSVTG